MAGVDEVIAMLAPPVGAGPERVTVQAVCDPGVTVDGVQLRLETVITGWRVIAAVEEAAPSVAVTTAD